jgi:hypothetical protein
MNKMKRRTRCTRCTASHSLPAQRNKWRSNLTTVSRSTASEAETISLSRVFLEGCLKERLSQEEEEEKEAPIVLDWRQREFLELVARSATFRGDTIAVPKELLEAFLAG